MARLPLLLEYGVPPPAASCGFYFPFWFKSGCGATPRIEIIDTHDGERKRKRWEEQRRAKEQLREDVLAAFAQHLEPPELVELAIPGPEPVAERIDLDALFADLALSQRVREAARAAGEIRLRAEMDRAEREREDEELAILLLL